MQQFLYRIEPVRVGMITEAPTERESAIAGEHFEYLQRLTREGTVLMAGRTFDAGERTFGIVILLAESAAHAAQIMRNDPAVLQGVMRAELFPYRIALWSRSSRALDDLA